MAADFLLVAITLPDFYEGEADDIAAKLAGGFDRVHIRKPAASLGDIRKLLNGVPEALHGKLSLHDGHELQAEFPLVRRHFTSRNAIADPTGVYSASIHSLEETEKWPEADYLLLSPIYDSISKPGYRSRFSLRELTGDPRLSRIIALGGITSRRLEELRQAGFRGAAMLGSAGWKNKK